MIAHRALASCKELTLSDSNDPKFSGGFPEGFLPEPDQPGSVSDEELKRRQEQWEHIKKVGDGTLESKR